MAVSVTRGGSRHDRITVRELADMVRRGEIDEDERLELVEGRLVSYSPPQDPPHAGIARDMPFLVRDRLRGRAVFSAEKPLIISPDTQLEPDLAILALREDRYRTSHPQAGDVHCVIEISDSSLRHDRTVKLRLYAEAGIPEYWIVDVRTTKIEICRSPHDAQYRDRRVAERADTVAFVAFPDVVFTVDELLG